MLAPVSVRALMLHEKREVCGFKSRPFILWQRFLVHVVPLTGMAVGSMYGVIGGKWVRGMACGVEGVVVML